MPRLAAALLVASALGGCGSAGFEDGGAAASDNLPPDQAVMKRIMGGLGAVDPRDEKIDYTTRPGLAIPPKRELPSPQTPEEIAAAKGQAWPNDPDIAAREMRKARAEGRMPTPPDPSRPWTPDEQARFGVVPGTPVARGGFDTAGRTNALDDPGRPLSPDELKGRPWNKDAVMVDGAGNPIQRGRTLTQPPERYMQPSPNAPVEEPKAAQSGFSFWPFR